MKESIIKPFNFTAKFYNRDEKSDYQPHKINKDMAKDKKTDEAQAQEQVPAQQQGQAQEQAPAAPQSARDRYRSRYSTSYPDMNLDDEEAFYTQANANLDELEDFRESNRQLGEAFDKAPLLAGVVLAAKEGENPFTYLAENIGPDMDIRELANNPEFGTKMGDALSKFQEKQAADAKRAKEIGDNMEQSFNALKELQQERGMSNEDCIALVKRLFGDADENGEQTDGGIIGNASMGIVPKEIWEAVLKAQNYDSDIASATEKARATALNEKVQNGLRDFGTGLPQSMTTSSTGKKEKKKTSSFADWGT